MADEYDEAFESDMSDDDERAGPVGSVGAVGGVEGAEGAEGEAGTEEKPPALLVAPALTAYPDLGLVVQAPSPLYALDDDPLLIALDASSSMRKVELDVLGEALTRLFTYLAATGRRVTVLVFHAEVVLVHPAEPHVFPLMQCELVDAKGGPGGTPRVTEHMTATLDELATALHQPVKAANVEFLVNAYMNIVKAGGAAAVRHTWLTSTLRLAATILRTVATRTAHAHVLLMCDGGEFYGTDAGGRQAYLEAPAIVDRLVPAFATLPCTVSVNCLALGPDAELDTLASIAYALDGALVYAAAAAGLGDALAAVFRFLSRRPAPVLLPAPVDDAWPLPAVAASKATYATARTVQAFGATATADGLAWAGALAAGGVFGAAAGAQLVDNAVEPAAVSGDAPPMPVAKAAAAAPLVREALAAAWPLVSWRPKVVAAADTPALAATFAALIARAQAAGVPRYVLTALELVATPAGATARRAAIRAGFAKLVTLALQPFMPQIDVPPWHAEALEALPVVASVVESRRAFEADFPRWVAAKPERAARYACSVMHDARELLAAPVVARAFPGSDVVLWAPNPKHPGLVLGPALTLDDALIGVETHAVLAARPWSAADIAETADGGAYEVAAGGARVPKASRQGRELAAIVAAEAARVDVPPLVLPLFLRLDDAMSAYASMGASKALAAVASPSGAGDGWADTSLPLRVYGGAVAAWLHSACVGDATAKPPAALMADVCRALALTVEHSLVADMHARFVKGTAAKEELEAAEKDGDEAELARLKSGSAWRGPAVAGSLPALGAVLALYRSAREYARAKEAAIKAYVAAAVRGKAAAEAADVDAEVDRRLRESNAARVARGLPPYTSRKDVAAARRLLKAALIEERASTIDGGAELDAKEREAALEAELRKDAPADLDVAAHLVPARFRIEGYADNAVPVIAAEAAARGFLPAYVDALAAKLVQLHELAEPLIHAVPAPPALLARVAAVFACA